MKTCHVLFRDEEPVYVLIGTEKKAESQLEIMAKNDAITEGYKFTSVFMSDYKIVSVPLKQNESVITLLDYHKAKQALKNIKKKVTSPQLLKRL